MAQPMTQAGRAALRAVKDELKLPGAEVDFDVGRKHDFVRVKLADRIWKFALSKGAHTSTHNCRNYAKQFVRRVHAEVYA